MMREDLGSVRWKLSEFMQRQDRVADMDEEGTLLQYLPRDNPIHRRVLEHIVHGVQNRKSAGDTGGLVP